MKKSPFHSSRFLLRLQGHKARVGLRLLFAPESCKLLLFSLYVLHPVQGDGRNDYYSLEDKLQVRIDA